MVLSFEIIKLFNHHNRGQAIAARQLNFIKPVVIEEGALLNGIPVYHYLDMYPIDKDQKDPKFDIYVFRPTELKGFPKRYFQEGQIVELFQIDNPKEVLFKFQNEIQESIPKLFNLAKSLTWNNISENYKFILTEIENSSKNFTDRRKINKKENDKKVPVPLAELTLTLEKLYVNLYDVNLQIYKSTNSLTIIDFRYYLKSSLNDDHRHTILHNHPMLHVKVPIPPWLGDKKTKFNINWEQNGWLTNWKLFWGGRTPKT